MSGETLAHVLALWINRRKAKLMEARVSEVEPIVASMTEDEKLYMLGITSWMEDIETPLAGVTALGLSFPECSIYNVYHPKKTVLGMKVLAYLEANPPSHPANMR